MRVRLPWFILFIAAACGPAETPPPPAAAPMAPAATVPPPPPPVAIPTPAEPPAAPPPAATTPAAPAGPDPLTVGPTIYKLVFENERVRVLDVSFKPGEEIAMHAHPDHTAYVRSGGKLKVSRADAAPEDFDLKPGQAVFLPAQAHSAKNVGKTPIKIVVVEIKPGTTPGVAPPGEDPVKVGQKIYKQIFDNDSVRVLQITFEKGAKIAMHTHPDHVVYATSGGKLRITPAQGSAQDAELKEGKAVYIPAQAHSAENVGATKVQAIVFELKGPKA